VYQARVMTTSFVRWWCRS